MNTYSTLIRFVFAGIVGLAGFARAASFDHAHPQLNNILKTYDWSLNMSSK